MFPEKFINELKEKIDLVELASEYTELQKVGINLYQGPCPNPNHDDKNPSFRVWTRGYNGSKYDSWACMVCHSGNKNTKSKEHRNYGSDCFAFYQWMEGVNWKQAVIDLAQKYNVPLPNSEFDRLYKMKQLQTESYIRNLYSEPLKYLYDRGLTDVDISSWKIGFEGNKIVFPLLDKYRYPIAFTKRWLVMPEGRNDKYKNSYTSKIFNKSTYFYGIHNLDNDFDEIRITEGPMDVILSTKYGAKNIVATLGTAFTDDHVKLIKSMNKNPVFIMDGDGPGIAAAEKAVNKLAQAGIYSKILILPNGEDLCDLSLDIKEGIEDYIKQNAMTYGFYKMQKIINIYDNHIMELKLKSFKDIEKVLAEIPDDTERAIIKDYVLKKMDMRL